MRRGEAGRQKLFMDDEAAILPPDPGTGTAVENELCCCSSPLEVTGIDDVIKFQLNLTICYLIFIATVRYTFESNS